MFFTGTLLSEACYHSSSENAKKYIKISKIKFQILLLLLLLIYTFSLFQRLVKIKIFF